MNGLMTLPLIVGLTIGGVIASVNAKNYFDACGNATGAHAVLLCALPDYVLFTSAVHWPIKDKKSNILDIEHAYLCIQLYNDADEKRSDVAICTDLCICARLPNGVNFFDEKDCTKDL